MDRAASESATTSRPLPVVDCPKAAPRERGRAHGEGLRAIIRDKIRRWRSAIEEAYCETPSSFLSRFLAQTQFRPAIARHTPDLDEEVHGVAEGAGLDFDLVYALQLMDEEWWFGRMSTHGHCSSAGFAPLGSGPSVLGQTMDLPSWHDGAQALLRFRNDDGSETLIFTSAGMIGLMGLAGHGMGLCVNTLAGLRSRCDGLPVAFVVRGALARKDLSDAARFITAVPHASGQNYTLADRRTVRAFECSAAGAVELDGRERRIFHANHPLISDDWRPGAVAHENSVARLAALRRECHGEAVSADVLRSALSSRRDGAEISIQPGVGSAAAGPMSIGGVVYEIGAETRFWVSAGPPNPESWSEASIGGPSSPRSPDAR